MIGRLEGLHIKTGFIKVYRLEYASRDTVIGQMKKANIDDGHAFIV
ncbi:MAG: hypothetical protein L3J18_16405 [Candidatus Brocadia sp.]|nr:hypothetical protein [Candidatus Brocadia sp.]UJS20452.1 MAG: hypothetical protein L3J18_16405 [Candidatus Brocadia sp.]